MKKPHFVGTHFINHSSIHSFTMVWAGFCREENCAAHRAVNPILLPLDLEEKITQSKQINIV